MTATDAPTNEKAGWSSYCQRDQHRTCTSLGARCTCSCHGKQGQTPPETAAPRPTPTSPTTPRRPAMPDAAPLAAVPDPPDNPIATVQIHTCDDCGRQFANPQGLGRHRSSQHGSEGKRVAPAKKAAAPKFTRPVVTPQAPGHIVAVAVLDDQDVRLVAATFTTDLDAERAERLLTDLGHAPVRIPTPEA